MGMHGSPRSREPPATTAPFLCRISPPGVLFKMWAGSMLKGSAGGEVKERVRTAVTCNTHGQSREEKKELYEIYY